MVEYGQLVIGPPGSGKTTYCEGMRQLLASLKRPHLVINLDFANDWNTKIEHARKSRDICEFAPPDVDVRELITVDQAMKEHGLGPNGALIYCSQVLSKNVDWLKSRIKEAKQAKGYEHAYMLIDMPGQVELYTVDRSLHSLIKSLADRDRGLRLVAMHLVDSTLCIQIHHYISALLVSLSAQMGIELPFLNVFTKVDLLKEEELEAQRKRSSLSCPYFNSELTLEYLARCEDLDYLVPMAHPISTDFEAENNFAQFHKEVIELVEDFSLVGFLPLNIQDKESALSILGMADNANGFAMSAYVPKRLRVPGQEDADEFKIDCGLERKMVYGSEWYKDR